MRGSRGGSWRKSEDAPVDDAGTVKARDAVDDLADVEACAVSAEAAPPRELSREVAAGVEVEREVQGCAQVEA